MPLLLPRLAGAAEEAAAAAGGAEEVEGIFRWGNWLLFRGVLCCFAIEELEEAVARRMRY